MKTISIKQPWAYLIFNGKDIENRTWPTHFRGRVLIHVSAINSKNWVEAVKAIPGAWDKISIKQKDYSYSAIIGSVEIVDCVVCHPSIWAEKREGRLNSAKQWIEKPIYNWVLANPVLFAKPITNVKGKLSFWDYGLTEESYLNMVGVDPNEDFESLPKIEL